MSARAMRMLGAVVLLAAAACVTGMSEERYARRQGPFGATTRLGVAGGRVVTGELLAIGDSMITIMERQRVVVVPFGAVRSLAVEGLPPEPGSAIYHARYRREAALRSRYVGGLAPEIMVRLLARAGQQAPDTVRAAAR